jgi:hypothetical protein
MSVLNSEFMSDSIREIVPEVARVSKDLAASSVLTGRRRVRIVPQNGQSFVASTSGSSAMINWLISDGASFMDPTSAVLSFSLTTRDASAAPVAGTEVVLDDGAWSAFSRLLVSVNSTLVDDIDQLPKKVNSQLYPTVSQSWYDSVGSFCGLWKFSNTAWKGAATDKYNVAARRTAYAAAIQNGTSTSALANGKNNFMIPLSLLSGFFTSEQLLPLPHMGQLRLSLSLADALSACVASIPGATPGFRIDDVSIECDFVEVHPTYGALIAKLCREDEGIMVPYQAALVSSQDIPASAGGNSSYNIVFSKATPNLRAITTFQQAKAGLSSAAYPKTSTFANNGFYSIQYRIGSQYYPAMPSVQEARAFADLQGAFGRPGNSLETSGLCDANNYYLTTTVGGDGSLTGNAADLFLHAVSFDKLKGARFGAGGVDLDGVNTMQASGAQVVIQLVAANTQAAVVGAVINYTRVLRIRQGAISIVG